MALYVDQHKEGKKSSHLVIVSYLWLYLFSRLAVWWDRGKIIGTLSKLLSQRMSAGLGRKEAMNTLGYVARIDIFGGGLGIITWQLRDLGFAIPRI